jgi:hypothetical protein
LLVPNHTALTTRKNIEPALSGVMAMLRRTSSVPLPTLPVFFASSCSAPRHQYGMASCWPPNTPASSTPMIGAWSSMIAVPPTSRAFTLK